ncbi:hypothetical protein [Falsiroseomonas sp. E2-1-a20]|uniref:hypothetical protein n=1 Tax=Falsiroseomonas sp. E2-1-a20 TaxID=3239300 RepID=UPI003F302986
MSTRPPLAGLVLMLLAGALLAGCGTPLRSAAGGEAEYLPEDLPRPRARRPSSERPPWLPVLPPNIPRIRMDEGLRANLG